MRTVFDFYSDPGHGWIKVPIKLLDDLDILDKITACSYLRGQYAYLEEDCDATTFCNALETHGIKPRFHSRISDKSSKIRGYAPFNASLIFPQQ